MKKLAITLLTILGTILPSAIAQTIQAPGGVNFGNGVVVKESSGNGAPSLSCSGLTRYTQLDATNGSNVWVCVNGSMVQQNGGGSGSGGSACSSSSPAGTCVITPTVVAPNGVQAGSATTGNVFALTPLSSLPSPWTMDVTTPTTAIQSMLPGVAGDGNSGITSGAVNGILDLKAKFGATGSQATMTCTATGGSSVLTGCTGGDFRVGQWVFLPAMGLAATATTPVAPTLACVSHSGGSCTGTTVYGYKIVAVQGLPNGTLTPAGPAQTITQATHIMQQIANSGNPDVGTTISWSAVTNAAFYYIYKSVNGGAYNYYTHTIGGTTITDYGGMGSAGLFTCVDEGVPCTAPSTTTPNDVYAQITAINGGTVTIAANLSQPKYNTAGGLGATTMPSQPVQSGTVIVQHDDTPAFLAAYVFLAALQNKGQVELHIPSGSYNVHSVNPYGSAAFFMLNGLNNLIFQGNGVSTRIYDVPDRANSASGIFGVCGTTTIQPTGGCLSFGPLRSGGGPSYSVVDPVNAGQRSVTLTTPSDASHFPIGQYVTLGGTGTPYPADTYGELNLVTASDATTGIVKLAYPINKVYSTTLPAMYSTGCANCAAAPAMGPITPNPTATHIKFKNFWFRGDVRFLNVNTIDDLEESGLTVLSNGTEGEGIVRHRLFTGNTISEDGFFNSQSMLANAAVGSSDYIVTNNSYTTTHGSNTGQPCSEGSVNELFANNTYHLSGQYQNPASTGAFMGMGWGCWGLNFTGNNVTITNDSMAYVITANDGGGSAIYTGNQFNIDNVSPAGSSLGCVQTQGLSGAFSKVFNNVWNITTPGKSCYKQTGSSTTLATVDSLNITGSGTQVLYPYYGSQTVFNYTLTANITSISLGSTRIPGYLFMINFIQDATGGHWLPTTCGSTAWGVAIDCINGTPIQISLAANSSTYVWFYDDGTTVHELWTSEPSMATYATYTTPSLSGNIVLYAYYPLNAKILNVPITGNVTQVSLTGGRHAANAYFGIAFIQDATGGRTLPSDCLEAHWAVGASGIDCPSGAPKLNPAANSTTYLWFFDDGTLVHFLGSNYSTGYTLPAASTTVLGGVKCDGTTTTCAGDGTITSTAGAAVSFLSGLQGLCMPSNAVTTTLMNCLGDGIAVLTGSAQAFDSTGSPLFPITTRATSDATAAHSAGWLGARSIREDEIPQLKVGIGFRATTDYSANSRVQVGFLEQTCTQATLVVSDTPACTYAMIWRSTARGDTDYMCQVDNGSGTPTVTAITGSAPSAAFTIQAMTISLLGGATPTSVVCKVGNATATVTTTLPASGKGFDVFVGNSYPGGGVTHISSNGWQRTALSGSF